MHPLLLSHSFTPFTVYPFHPYMINITTSYNKKHEVERAPQVRLFVSSLSFDNTGIAALGYRALREHWGIENKLHWCLDMDFGLEGSTYV